MMIRISVSENFHVLVVQFSIYLNRRGFVMKSPLSRTNLHGPKDVLASHRSSTVLLLQICYCV